MPVHKKNSAKSRLSDATRLVSLMNSCLEISASHNITVGYPRLYSLVIQGLIPSVRRGSRWFLRSSDFPKIAAKLRK